MRRLLIIMLLMPTICWGQPITAVDNWVIEDGEAVFVKVYEVDKDSAELYLSIKKFISSQGMVKEVIAEETIVCKLDNFIVDYKRYGLGSMTAPYIFSSGRWFGSVSISIKHRKYRVKIAGIRHDTSVYGLAGSSLTETGVSGTWTDIALKKSREAYKPSQDQNCYILSDSLEKHFTLQEKVEDDW